MMNIGFIIGSAAASVVFFVTYYLLSSANYKKIFKDRFDFRNHFPYEFNYELRFKENLYGNIALILAGCSSIAFYVLSAVYKNNNGLLIFSLVAGVLFSLFFIIINFVPLKLLKTHLGCSIFMFVMAFVLPGTLALALFKNYQETNNTASLVFFIIAIMVALYSFALTMNPKLSLNIKMNVAKDNDGNEHYVRPKFIVMALTEWLMTLSLLFSDALLIILLFILD